ncbi:MAG TPA: hypothetical protein VHM92_04435 [Allosphingosinicella sp.]|nr:hypothetical protein [Allosphingosinicella sp.]
MGQERAEQAIGRIERALARIESAAHRIAATPMTAAADGELREKHQALRESVGDALARLDTLLAAGERS